MNILRFALLGLASASFASLAVFACSSGNPAAANSPVDASMDVTAPIIDAKPEAAPKIWDSETAEAAAGIVAARPYTLVVPTGYDAKHPTPLVVMFHGYGFSGSFEEVYMNVSPTAQSEGFLYAYGDGTLNKAGKRFWNATDGCCNQDGSTVDDVGYFNAIVDDVAAKYNVDPKRVYVLGHSNGAFMAHRLACDLAPRVAAIVSLAGAVWEDPSKCTPSEPVSILDIHGDADMTISYNGGTSTGPYPSEHTTMATWATKDGCTGQLTSTPLTLDIDSALAGNETVTAAVGGCPTGIDVQLWTIHGGGHIPTLNATWGSLVWGFMKAHPKP